jgi:predicted RNase H-like nuclease (RuvC/YqgF family)
MKKNNTIFFSLLFTFFMACSFTAASQNASEKQIKIEKKKTLNGFEIQFDGMSADTEKSLEIAIEKWLDSQKIKYKHKKGNYHAEEVVVKQLSEKTSDLYIFVEEKKGRITLQVVQTLGYDMAVSSKNQPQEAQNIRFWLENMVKEVRLEQLNLKIVALQDNLKNAEEDVEKNQKTDESLKNSIEEAKKQIADAEKDIEKNAASQKENEQKRDELKMKIAELERMK